MGTRLLEHRLRTASRRLGELRRELSVVEDQLAHLVDEAHDKELRALVAETPTATFEHREASAHADAMGAHRDRLLASITEWETRVDELLERVPVPDRLDDGFSDGFSDRGPQG